MNPVRFLVLAIALLFVAATMAVPCHLALEHHHGDHHHSDEDRHEDPAHPPHAAGDHQGPLLARSIVQLPSVELTFLEPPAMVVREDSSIATVPIEIQRSFRPPQSVAPPGRGPPAF